MTNIIASIENTLTSSDCAYTATQDCWANFLGYRASSIVDGTISLNNVIIVKQYLVHDYEHIYVFIPLKAGDTIKFNTSQFYKEYTIYGVR